MQLRDRIKELRRVPASQLRPNPKNWRTHPEAQQNALRGVLAEIGIANAVLARELPDGSLMLIDGHLRAETLGAETVPVLVLDVDEAEADKLLVTLDPLAAMAEADEAQLKSLIDKCEFASESIKELVSNIEFQYLDTTLKQEEILDAEDSKEPASEQDYRNSAIRQIVLVFQQDEYELIIDAMGEHAEKFGLVTNTDVVKHLLETNGYAISRPE